jgi:hypothetical protein
MQLNRQTASEKLWPQPLKGSQLPKSKILTNANRVSIRQAVDAYLEQKKTKARSTVRQYRPALNDFIEYEVSDSTRGKKAAQA